MLKRWMGVSSVVIVAAAAFGAACSGSTSGSGSSSSGRGWAEIGKDGKLRGRIYFHHGDDSSFVAARKKGS